MSILVLGIEFGNNVCSLVGLDEGGAVVLRRRLRREGVADFVGKMEPCIVAMEACCGAHHLGRVLGTLGHAIRLSAGICAALCEGEQERRTRCRGDRGGCDAAEDALRADQERRAIGHPGAASSAFASGGAKHGIAQTPARSFAGARNRCGAGAQAGECALGVFADEHDPRLSPRIRVLIEDLRTEWRSLDERIAAF